LRYVPEVPGIYAMIAQLNYIVDGRHAATGSAQIASRRKPEVVYRQVKELILLNVTKTNFFKLAQEVRVGLKGHRSEAHTQRE
jgi:hypothetical protein